MEKRRSTWVAIILAVVIVAEILVTRIRARLI